MDTLKIYPLVSCDGICALDCTLYHADLEEAGRYNYLLDRSLELLLLLWDCTIKGLSWLWNRTRKSGGTFGKMK